LIRLLARMASREAMRTRAEFEAIREIPYEYSARERRAAAQVERLKRQLARSEEHLSRLRGQLAEVTREPMDVRGTSYGSRAPIGLPGYLGATTQVRLPREQASQHYLVRHTARLLTEGIVFGFALFVSLTAIFTALALVF
jgi:hypothetical protein